jgi:DNA polymerase III subunit gamma/tau
MAKSKASPPKAPEAPPPEAPPAYTVVARRYRPQQFTDLIGQEHIATALTNALTTKRLAQAYLFTGARGTGKTSTARIFAKALNCEHGPTATPCDQCQNCLNIMGGDDTDAMEIDAASNNGVDYARELRQNVGFKPSHSRYKIYIIDEVHMLSKQAFDALLKTFEEPPPHVKFVMATTEFQKVPITILSRCQRFDFNTVGPGKIFETLKHIVKKEGLKADDDALQIVAKRANGSMRDSQTLLDQLLGVCEGELTLAKVHGLLGTASDDRMLGLANAILAGDTQLALRLVGEASERGLQLGELLDQLIDYWRGLMLASVGGEGVDPLLGTAAIRESIGKHVAGKSLDTILAGLDILSAAKGRMRHSVSVLILMEIAVVRLSRLEDLLPVAELTQWLQTGVKSGLTVAKPAATAAVPPEGRKKKPGAVPEGKPATAPPSANGFTDEEWPGIWERVLGGLGGVLAENLRRLPERPAILGPNALAIRHPAAYTTLSERSVEQLRSALQKFNGKEWALRFEVIPDESGPPRGDQPAAPAVAAVSKRQEMLNLPFFQSLTTVLGSCCGPRTASTRWPPPRLPQRSLRPRPRWTTRTTRSPKPRPTRKRANDVQGTRRRDEPDEEQGEARRGDAEVQGDHSHTHGGRHRRRRHGHREGQRQDGTRGHQDERRRLQAQRPRDARRPHPRGREPGLGQGA